METKSNKKKIFAIVGVVAVIAIICAVVAGITIGNKIKEERRIAEEKQYKADQEQIINDEVNKITIMDPTVDEVDVTIYSEGDYAKVESSIKAYFTEFFATAKAIDALSTDERFTILNDSSTVMADAPAFTNTLGAIDTMKSEITTNTDKIADLLNEDTIKSYMDTDVDQEYIDLYNEVMTSGTTTASMTLYQTQISMAKDETITFIDKYRTMIAYLADNQGVWSLEGTTPMFTDQAALDQYNAYVNDFNTAREAYIAGE